MQELSHAELTELACSGNEEAQALLSKQSMDYAKATAHANSMQEIMTQTFTARIKSNKDAYNALTTSLSAPWLAAKMLGKEYEFRVYWGACGGIDKQHYCFFEFREKGSNHWLCAPYILMDEKDMKAIFTQKGLAPKMFAVWKLAAGK